MFDWILLHSHGLLDWLLVYFVVFLFVFGIQGMINFYTDKDESDDE